MQQGMLPDRQRSSFIALLVKRLCRCFSQTCGGQSVYTGLHGCACAVCMGWVRMRSLHGCARAAVDKDTGPSPAGGSGARPPILNLCPSFHVWLPGCCIHPILYLKYVPPPLLFLARPAAKSWRRERALLSHHKKALLSHQMLRNILIAVTQSMLILWQKDQTPDLQMPKSQTWYEQ